MGNGGLRSEGAFRGGLRGTGPALAGIVREAGLSRCARWGLGCCDPMLATAQPRCRRCVVGVRVGFCWGGVDGEWGFGIGGGGG